MNKSILILGTVIIVSSVTAFGFMSERPTETTPVPTPTSEWLEFQNDYKSTMPPYNGSDFVYKVESRFNATITKEDLHSAKTIIDILPDDATTTLSDYQTVKVVLLGDGNETAEAGIDEVLNTAQLSLLQTADYSTDFYIRANCKNSSPGCRSKAVGPLYSEDYDLVYYLSVIPEKEAEYKGGKTALIDYLKQGSSEEVANRKAGNVLPGKVRFMVSRTGEIGKVKLESSCGHTPIDDKMIELIQSMPGGWEPAANTNGEKVDQELIFSFGILGC